MKERRSLFNMIFGNRPQQLNNSTQLKLLNGYIPVFSQFGEEAYDSDVVRAAVDAIARNGAKLKPKHIRRVDNRIQNQDSNISRLLSLRPNKYMDAYTFYYKVITQLYMQNNSFIFIDFDPSGYVKGFYPINSCNTELLECQGEIYARFSFMGGQKVILPYVELIHLRRFFYKNDFFGETNNTALIPTLELINTTNEGIVNAVKSSAFLRGLLKFSQTMLKPEDLKKHRDNFVNDYMNITNNSGVAALDAKADYVELKNDPKLIDDKQMSIIEDKVYNYFGVSKAIVTSKYNEDEWNAFYESVLEPIAIQMSLEFTAKLFSDREKGFGNEIIFESNRLQYASNKTKISLTKDLMPMGLFTINEIREIFNLAPVDGGDKRLQTLNVVDANKANQYQGVDDGGEDNNDGNQNSSE